MRRDKFAKDLNCKNCGQAGVAVWEENSCLSEYGPQRRLISLHGRFHWEEGRTASGDPVIVCTNCDEIQPD